MAKPSWLILIALVWIICLGGCTVLPEPAQQTSWLKSQHPLNAAMEGEVVLLDVRILERPLGDPFINQELWQHTDELVVDLDRKATVEDNGFRVGQIVGMTPGKFQDLLKSQRYCVDPRRHVVPSGHSITPYLAPVRARAEFVLQEGKQSHEVLLERARFGLEVKATLTGDGKTRLSFIPKVENGEATLPFQPDPEQQAWTIRVDRPCRSYPELSWDVVLAPGEYLVIGAILPKEKSLGHRSFVHEEGNSVQRLLVLCTGKAPSAADTGEHALEGISRGHPSPCLAVQASMTAVRASEE